MALNKPRCALICVGSELLRGKINTHASTIARRFASIGLELTHEQTVSDAQSDITEAIRGALERFNIVITTGGLGPTFDDLTREAASDATERPLVLSQALLQNITQKFRRAKYAMPPMNKRQAYLLEGASAIDNPVGTAPGQWLDLHGKVLILLPGPPRELHPMLEKSVVPALKKIFPAAARAEAHFHFVGLPESVVDTKVRPIIAAAQKHKDVSIEFTILAHLGLVDLDVFVSGSGRSEKILRGIVKTVRVKLGSAFYGMENEYPLEKAVGNYLRKRKTTVAAAESCTGGLLAAALTSVAGSSDYFMEGIVSYTNESKVNELDVSSALLKKHGAVSRPVALAMAEGIRKRAGSSIGIGITGIAGPDGGTSSKPVGLVYVALVSSSKKIVQKNLFSGDREAIRQRAVLNALDLLRKS